MAVELTDRQFLTALTKAQREAVATLADDEDIVTAAAHALFEDPAADGKDWAQCEQIARTVLRSVGGAS